MSNIRSNTEIGKPYDGMDAIKQNKNNKEAFEQMISHYLESNPIIIQNHKMNELEIRFGTNRKFEKPITKIDYDNVVNKIYTCGFSSNNVNGEQLLRIREEYIDVKTNQKRMNNVRAEIIGTDLIQEYCKTNSLQKLIDMPSNHSNQIKFTKKMNAISKNGDIIKILDMHDYNFRVSYQTEQDFTVRSERSRQMVNNWADSKKTFRSLNRVRFHHDKYPIFVDLSIVKSSKQRYNVAIPKYTIQEAGVFENVAEYEIELEIDNSNVGAGTEYNTANKLTDVLRKCIRMILSGLQGSNYPISIPERNHVLQKYIQIAQQLDVEFKGRILPKHFIGPNSKTLQINNILTDTDALTDVNIRNNYTVTDKADGDRKLLYISGDGKLYLIDTNMNVIFTGTKTKEQTIYNSIIDGEHIKYDKHGKFINLYAAFDIYYVNSKSMRELPFIMRENDADKINKDRLSKLTRLIEIINPTSCIDNGKTDFQVKCKTFNVATENSTIFDGCLKILSNVNDGLFEYNTDGLIFTPAHLPVGGNTEDGPPGPNVKFAWKHSFKWKPPEYNTIDFLVHVTKNSAGNDDVHNIFKDGRNLQGVQNTMSYKTLNLLCGFDKVRDIHANPCLSLINGFSENVKPENANENSYVPLEFYPTNPYDDNAHKCNIMLIDDGTKLYMKTEEGEYFEDNMIVEFKYMANNANGWKWIPIRVRNDKTAELNAGLRNY